MTGVPDFRRHPFSIRRCAACNYDLSGQPEIDRCPECGQAYDNATFLLVGDHVMQPTKWRFVGFLGFAWFFIAPTPLRDRLLGPIGPYVGIAIILLVIGLVVYRLANRRRYGTKGGDAHMVITTEGVASRTGVGPLTIVPWSDLPKFKFQRRYRWRLTRTKRVSPSWYVRFAGPNVPNFERGEYATRDLQRRGGMTIFDLWFEATEVEAAQLERDIRSLRTRAGLT